MVGRTAADQQRGAVTAEAAVVLPLLVSVTLGLVWLLALAVTQVRVIDAAREVARAAARDESGTVATAQGARIAPAGALIHVDRGDGTVRVRVEAEVTGPGGLFRFLPGVTVTGEAVAATEGP